MNALYDGEYDEDLKILIEPLQALLDRYANILSNPKVEELRFIKKSEDV